MKCKNCGASAEKGLRYCPQCGEPFDVPEEDYAPVADDGLLEEPAVTPDCIHDESAVTGDCAHDEPTAPLEAPASPSKRKGKTGRSLVAIILIGALLLGGTAALIAVNNNDKNSVLTVEASGGNSSDGITVAPTEEGVTLVDDDPLPTRGAVVATCNGHELTNENFLFYYWDELYYVYSMYGEYITYLFDPTVSLATQEYENGTSWRQYFTESAINTWAQTVALDDAARSENFSINTENQQLIDDLEAQLTTTAESYGYESAEAYLHQTYDDAVTIDDYRIYLTETHLATDYVSSRYDGFFAAHSDLAGQEKYCIDVRHILIQNADDTDTAKKDARTEAERIYALWQEEPTEDHFAELAEEYTEDGGSQSNGGLYEGVAPGETVTEFNDWCFDASRKTGDHGIVDTEYGSHVMYFIGTSETAYENPQEDAAAAEYDEWVSSILEPAVPTRTDTPIGYSR